MPQAVTIGEMIREVERELAMRQRTYPRLVERGSISSAQAARQVRELRAAALAIEPDSSAGSGLAEGGQ